VVAPAVVVAEPVCKEQNKFIRGEFSAAAVKYMHLTLEPNCGFEPGNKQKASIYFEFFK
jgi:hypothetical protein